MDDRRQDRGKVALGYTVQAGQDVLRRPATLLEFSDRLKLGIAGPRYGFKRALDGDEHDPVWD